MEIENLTEELEEELKEDLEGQYLDILVEQLENINNNIENLNENILRLEENHNNIVYDQELNNLLKQLVESNDNLIDIFTLDEEEEIEELNILESEFKTLLNENQFSILEKFNSDNQEIYETMIINQEDQNQKLENINNNIVLSMGLALGLIVSITFFKLVLK